MNLFILLFLALVLIVQFWAIIDIAFTKRMENKALWFLAIILFSCIRFNLLFPESQKGSSDF